MNNRIDNSSSGATAVAVSPKTSEAKKRKRSCDVGQEGTDKRTRVTDEASLLGAIGGVVREVTLPVPTPAVEVLADDPGYDGGSEFDEYEGFEEMVKRLNPNVLSITCTPLDTLAEARRGVDVSPESGRAHFALAEELVKAGEMEEAWAEYRNAADNYGGDFDLLLSVGRVFVRAERDEEALACYGEVKDKEGMPVKGIYMALAGAYASCGKMEEAWGYYRSAANSHEGDIDFLFEIGKIFALGDQFEDAITCLNVVLRVNPNYLDADTYLKMSYLGVLGSKPEDPEANYYLGEFSFVEEDFAEAFEYLSCVRGDLCESFWFNYYMGCSLYALERYDEAMVYFQGLREKGEGRDVKGLYAATTECIQRLGSVDEREEYFRKAVRLEPENPEALNNLCVFLNEQRRSNEAVMVMRKIQRLMPDVFWSNYSMYFLLKSQVPKYTTTKVSVNKWQSQVLLVVDEMEKRRRIEEQQEFLYRAVKALCDELIPQIEASRGNKVKGVL